MRSGEYSQPFTKIAPYYDRIMSFVNYRSWVSYIERIIMMYNIREKIITDIACGTGVCLELWLKKGYRVIGVDASESMLAVCKKRFEEELMRNGMVKIIQADLRNFLLEEKVPVITCLYDSLNYLLNADELLSCFKSVYANLKPDGIFIFDMNTIHALKDEWGNQTFERHDGPIHSIWDNSFDPRTHISTLKLTVNVFEDHGTFSFCEIHQEKAYSLDEIRTLALSSGFEVNLYRHLTFNTTSEFDTRILGIAKRAQ